jgi:hypothetical protein
MTRAPATTSTNEVNELSYNFEFDHYSGQQKQQDARQDGIGRFAFSSCNMSIHSRTVNERVFCARALRAIYRCGTCADLRIGIPDGKSGDVIKAE